MAQLSIDKTASTSTVDEPGGNVEFTVEIENQFTEPLTLSALDDELAGSLGSENSTCGLPRSIPGNGSYICQFSAFVAGNAGLVTPITTATATTDSGQQATASDEVTVFILNIPPTFEVVQTPETLDLQEPGGSAVFQLQITNTSVETDPITVPVPIIGGDASLISTTCEQTQIPPLAPENQYQCEYTVTLDGEPGDQALVSATVIAVDDESTDPQLTVESTVTFSDTLPSLAITQTPAQTSVTEPGGEVLFTLEIENTSSATDPLTLQAPVIEPAANVLSSDCHSDPITLAPGATESCQYSVAVSGNVGDLASVSVQVNGADDEGNPVSDSAESQVSFDDAAPVLILTQLPENTTIEEPGGPVTFTVDVLNDSADTDPLLVAWPLDFSTEGTASASLQGSDCPTQPAALAPGDNIECSYTLSINGLTGQTLNAIVALSAEDDEGNPVSDSASSLVTVRGSDFGDAPLGYPVTLEDNGAWHDITPGFSLGALIDAETDGLFSLAADGDDNTQLDDEDGVAFLDDLVPGLNSRVEVIGPPAGGVLDVWVDFNANDNWDDPGEHAIVGATLTGGSQLLNLAVPAGSAGGPTFARFRLSETGLNTPGGEGGPGEVEDYLVDIQGVAIAVTKAATPMQVMEPGDVVTFTVVVKNEGDVEFELVRLDDDLYGDIGNEVSCSLPQIVPANGQYQCAFAAPVAGNAGDTITNTVLAEATVRDELLISDTGQVTVEITDATPSIQIAQTPTEASVDEPGGTVSFQLTVSNTSMAGEFDPVTLSEILINPAGGVSNNTCTIPSPAILPGEPYTCSYDVSVAGNVGDSVPVQVAVSGVDDENQEATDTASSTVTFDDVAPSLALTLEPDTATVQQPGGPVSFTLTVSNTSVSTDPLDIAAPEITAIIDGEGSASVQNAAGCTAASLPTDAVEDYSCTFEILVENAVVGDSVDVAVTVSGTDDENNPVSGDATALITVSGIDYGDAPETYPTAGETAASHDIRLDFLLGELIDAEAGGQPSPDADADDLTDLDDEDGITLLADSLIPGLSGSLEVVGPEGGILDAWVDFNADGNWDESEHIIVAATLSADTDTLSLPVPASATSGFTFARFRLSEAGLESPAGPGGPGEVEDYLVEIETLGLTVAKTAIPETVPEPGDDVSFQISVQNTSSVPVELTTLDDDLQGDLNGQGDCALPQTLGPEGIYDCVYTAPISGPPDTIVTNMVTAVASIDGLQISADDTATVEILGLDPTLAVDLLPDPASLDEPGGSVDFSVAVENTSSAADPVTILAPVVDTTGTVSDNTCVATSIPPGESYECGFRVTIADSNAGTLIPVTVTVTGSDDEGVEVVAADTTQVEILDVLPSVELTQTPAEILVDQAVGLAQFTVTVRNTSVATDPITLDSITPTPSGEASATVENNTCAAGIEVLPGADHQCSYDLRVTGDVGQTLDADLSIAFSDDDGNSDTASVNSLVTITGTDHGDAPDSYPTLVENGGPTHTISPDFYLGMLVDAETDGLPSEDAQGDDLDNLDDEDGITFLEPLEAGSVVSLQAMVANEEGRLSAWMDFNQDGDWDDPGEQVLMDQGAGPGSTTLDIVIPAQALPGETFARFRLTRNSSVGVGGPAPDGEVEDYAITVEAAYDLALAKSASPDPLGLDQPLTYTLTVANAGPNDSSGGTITDVLPAGVAFLGSEDGCTANADTVSCPLGPLPAGEIAQIRFQVEVTDNTLETIENTATLVSNEADADPTNDEATAVVTLDVVAPTVVEVGSIEPTADGELGFCETAMVPITGLEVGFSEPMAQSGEGSVSLPGNYQVIGAGPDQDIETLFCGEVQGDDQAIPIDGVSYDATTDTATLSLNGGTPLPDQAYFLLACPGLSDLAGNPLDGDEDGLGGEEYLLQFRTEQDNLFDNGNLDCDLAGWIRGSQSTVRVEDDADDALISGSARVSQSSPNFALNQCVAITGGERYTVATRTRIFTNEPVTVEKRCDFYPQANCGGTVLERRMDGEVLEDTDLQWVLTEATFNAPPQALSARCGYVVTAPLNTSLDVYLDKLLLRLGGLTEPLIFSDGFE